MEKRQDIISRRDAIDALMEIMDRPKHADFLYTDEICKTLNELPSAQPERKTGKWLLYAQRDGIETGSECSQCGYHIYIPPQYGHNFCPNCGADMRGNEDE